MNIDHKLSDNGKKYVYTTSWSKELFEDLVKMFGKEEAVKTLKSSVYEAIGEEIDRVIGK